MTRSDARTYPADGGRLVIRREGYSVHPWRLRVAQGPNEGMLVCGFNRLRDAKAFALEVAGLPWNAHMASWSPEELTRWRTAYHKTDDHALNVRGARAAARMADPMGFAEAAARRRAEAERTP